MKYKDEHMVNGLIIVFCFLSILFLVIYGRAGRTYLEMSSLVRLPEGQLAIAEWKKNGVTGRVLFLFDRRIHALRDDSMVSEDTYVYQAVMNNIVRKVYHIVPDSSWSEVRDTLDGNPYVTSSDGIFRMTIEGAPLLVMRMDDIPEMKERVLVHVKADSWNDDEVQKIFALLKSRFIESDLVTISDNISPY